MQPAGLPPPRCNALAQLTSMMIHQSWAGTDPEGMVTGLGRHSVGHGFRDQIECTLPSHCREHRSLAHILVASWPLNGCSAQDL